MIWQFEPLNKEEQELILDAPALITLLIAGADDNIENKELSRAHEVLEVKSRTEKPELHAYFEKVTSTLAHRISAWRSQLPQDREARQEFISEKLSGLNQIFSKVDRHFATDLYYHFKELSLFVAQASGGLIGVANVSEQEKRYYKLPMLHIPANR